MSSDGGEKMRRYLRFVRYLPVQCTVLNSEDGQPPPLEGLTGNVNAGGIEMFLPEPLSVKTVVSVQVAGRDPLRGHIVSVGEAIPTLLGNRFSHGLAFENAVDASLVRYWVSLPEKRAHPRAPVQFSVEYTQAGTTAHGTCVNLSVGGMFIVTEDLPMAETEIVLEFTLPGLSRPLSVRAQALWVSEEQRVPGAISGMGVRFLDLERSDAVVIGEFVNRFFFGEESAPSESLDPPD